MRYDNILVLSDLDGTFQNKEHKEHAGNVEAVKGFISDGGSFTLATGRHKLLIEELVPHYKEICNAPLVLSNGAMFCKPEDMSIIAGYPMVREEIKEVFDEARARFPDCKTRVVFEDFELSDMGEETLKDVYKLVFYGKKEEVDEIGEYLRPRYSDRFWCVSTEETLFEVLNKNATKGDGVNFLRRYYRGEKKIVAMGDYENDIEMLKNADFAACPLNASDEIKSICDVVLCDNDNGIMIDFTEKLRRGDIEI